MAARRNNRWIYWLMVGLILVGLGGWFTGGAGGRRAEIGSVGGLEITAQEYANAVRNRIRQVEQQSGQTLTLAQAQAAGLDRAALAGLVSDHALDAEARRLGLSVGDARVAEAVRSTPAFAGLDGEFDRQMYREQLRRNGLSEGDFEASLRDDTARTMLQAAVLGGVPEPEAYGELIASYSNERRDVTWAQVDPASVGDLPEPTDADLSAFYEANPEAFTSPERRTIDYAWITPEMIAGSLTVDEADVRALYDERRDQFVQEERRLVERLVFPTEADAQAALDRIEAGEATFDDAVEERGLALSDVDLGDATRRDLGEAADTVFAAEPGDVVGPLPSSLGPALFRVNAVLAADEVTFEEAAEDLRAEIADERARDAISEMVAQVEDLVAGGATVEDLAERTDLEAGTIEWSGDASAGPAAYQEFRDAAAAAEEGDLPTVVELSDGGLLILRLDSVTPPALIPYEDVAQAVRSGWEGQARAEAVLAKAEAAAAAIASGATFEEQGLTPATETGLSRRDAVEGTPDGFIEAAFALEPGGADTLATGDGAIVLRLDAVTAANRADPNVQAESDAIAAQVSEGIAQDLYEAFARQLQVNTEVSINDRAISAVNAQLN